MLPRFFVEVFGGPPRGPLGVLVLGGHRSSPLTKVLLPSDLLQQIRLEGLTSVVLLVKGVEQQATEDGVTEAPVRLCEGLMLLGARTASGGGIKSHNLLP